MRALVGLAVVLLILWLLGIAVFRIATGLIHLVLLVALVLFLIGLFRRPTAP
jgi:hydrogenase-4 membrane subunit HyfE